MLLKEYRRMNGLTQEDVAEALGIPKRTYQNYEREVREADSDVLCRLADYYQISLDDLVGHRCLSQGDEQKEADELLGIFEALSEKNQAVLLDVARSLAAHYGEE